MDGVWEEVSSCLTEGECEVGATEQRSFTFCRVDERLCRADCTWGEWSTIVPTGECRGLGAFECDAQSQTDYICTSDCRRIDNPDCPVNP